jgi:hypothetical protein
MKSIRIEDFNSLHMVNDRPLFIAICGGIATGKSHVVRNFITNPSYILVDFDDFMKKFGYSDYSKSGAQWQHAMEATDEYMSLMKKMRLPIISQGTGGSYKWLKYRLEDSRSHGYDTALLHIHAPLEQAYKQNLLRKDRGQHYVRDHHLHFIETSAMRAKCNFNVLYREEPQLVDYICEYDNTIAN